MTLPMMMELRMDATSPTMRCNHLEQVRNVEPRTPGGCEECLRTDSWWLHLRLCLICGHVGCCDGSPNRHATKHFHMTRHPIMKSIEPDEDWGWCYVDELLIEPAPRPASKPNERDVARRAASLSSPRRH